MTIQLLLLRHGDARDPGSGDDASRQLSAFGETQARVQGMALKLLGMFPETILVSPLVRARQTAEIVQHVIGCGTISLSEHLTPSSDHRNIIREVNALGMDRILLVGHEPHLSALISLLVTGSRAAQIEMEKGSLACVGVSAQLKFGDGTLEWILPAAESLALLGSSRPFESL